MKAIVSFIFGLFTGLFSYSQDAESRESKYLMDLEISSRYLVCDTITLTSPKQTKLVIRCHRFGDTTVLKVETIFNYEASLKSSIYVRTEYFDTERRSLAWTYKSFATGLLLAGETNYYDVYRLLETFKWGSGEIGLRTKYFYDPKGNLVKEVDYRGGRVIRTRTY